MNRVTGSSFLRITLASLMSFCWTAHSFAQSATTNTQQSETQAPSEWPRSFESPAGATITLHQPQVTEWKGFSKLTALIASEYSPKGGGDPAYGVIEVTADTAADRETDEVTLSNIEVANINFSTLGREQLADTSLEIGKLLPTAPITVSLTRLTASLDNYEQLQDAKGFGTDAPAIYVSEKPAILLQTNGKPTTAPVKGADGLEFVVNTNWDLLATGDPPTYYLRIDDSWVSAAKIDGPWAAVSDLPAIFSKLPDDDNWKEARAAMPPQAFKDGVPVVYYSDKPAELVVIDGQPQLQPVENTDLQWVSNANSDLFFDSANSNWYFLASGRWFSAADLKGPWSFASREPAGGFPQHPRRPALFRSSAPPLPGTSESEEARLQASIPTTARVSRSDVTVDVTYFGDPEIRTHRRHRDGLCGQHQLHGHPGRRQVFRPLQRRLVRRRHADGTVRRRRHG